jgi:predicted DCC family thiol-disulfide oxidoreductase YuxK
MAAASTASPSGEELELFFDGDCPLCRREVAMMQRLDRRKRILFTDIAAPGFEPAPLGRDRATLVASIHARLPDGTFVTGVEAFRRAYAALGLGPLVAFSRWPVVSGIAERAYALFARNRLRWTGRCTVDVCSADVVARADPALASQGQRPEGVRIETTAGGPHVRGRTVY